MQFQRAILILLAVLLLAGCSAVSRPGGTGSNSIPLSTATPVLPTALHVTRPAINGYPSLNRRVQDTQAVQRLYRAAYALPVRPPGTGHCPLDNGIINYLIFLRGTTPLQQMTLQATGCRYLRLDQSDGVRLTTQAFQSLFLKTVGIPSLVPGVS